MRASIWPVTCSTTRTSYLIACFNPCHLSVAVNCALNIDRLILCYYLGVFQTSDPLRTRREEFYPRVNGGTDLPSPHHQQSASPLGLVQDDVACKSFQI